MQKHHPFTMVEILLALGVCAIGICSVMVLFPIGANASRDASMETNSANSADQLLHYLKFQITSSQPNWDNTVGSSATIPEAKPVDPGTLDLRAPATWTVLSTGDLGNNIFLCSTPGIYQIINDRTSTPAVKNTTIDSRILVYLWREEVMPGVTYDSAVRLLLEATWPAEITDYNARQKSTFVLEVFKPEFN